MCQRNNERICAFCYSDAPADPVSFGMHVHQPDREAYIEALRVGQLVMRILDAITATHPRDARELARYTNRMLKWLRRSNDCVGTRKGRDASLQAAVAMVEALILLNYLKDHGIEVARILAVSELLERVEDALRAEGSLPPAIG
jgi:hypothetical protein